MAQWPRLLVVSLAWFCGLAIAAWRMPPLGPTLALAVAAGWVWWGARRVGWRGAQGERVALVVMVMALGAVRICWEDWRLDAAGWEPLLGREVKVVGVVDDDPARSERSTRLSIRVEGVWANERLVRPSGLVQATVLATTRVSYGDRVVARGRLDQAQKWEDFDYHAFLARRGIYAVMRFPAVQIVEHGQGTPLRHVALALRGRAENTIQQVLPSPESELLAGVLLGLDDKLPAGTTTAFRRTGLSHLVVSGFNITLLAGFLSGAKQYARIALVYLAARSAGPWPSRRRVKWALAAFGVGPVMVVATVVIVFYVVLVGGGASAMRAGLMGWLVVWALSLGRPAHAPTILAASALIITVAAPWSILDVGFQLSFAGTLGLMALGGPVAAGLQALVPTRWGGGGVGAVTKPLATAAGATIAASLMTMPISAYYFDHVSVISLPANLLVLAAQPPLMLLGGAATILGEVALPLGRVAALLAYLPLAWTIRVADWLAQPSWAAAVVRLEALGLALSYGLIAILYLWLRWVMERRETTGWDAGAAAGQLAVQPPAEVTGVGEAPLALQPLTEAKVGTDQVGGERARRKRSAGGRRRTVGWAGVAVVVIVGWSLATGRPDGRLHIVLAEGGDGTLVVTPHGHRLILSAEGRTREVAALVGGNAPWNRELAVMAVARADAAALNGLIPLLERYRVGQVIAPRVTAAWAGTLWSAAVTASGGEIAEARPGVAAVLADGTRLEVVAVDERERVVVYRVVLGDVGVVVATGVRGRIEMAETQGDALVMSSRITAEGREHLIGRTRPSLVVFQGEAGETATVEAAMTMTSAERGRITLTSDGVRLWVATGR